VLADAASVEWLKSQAIGATMPNLNEGIIRRFPLRIPALAEQHAIALILGALDDKIELNRRMNETLEATARAIFKSWFVDFDPVRAKAEGRDPGLPKRVADLFPDQLVGSELGQIPEGWSVGSFASIAEILNGGTPRTAVPEYWHGEIPWYSVTDAPNPADLYAIDTERHITDLGVAESATQVLGIDTSIISARGTVGRLALVGAPMAMNQSCYALRAKSPAGPFFLFFATKAAVNTLHQRSYGTVFDTITRNTIESLALVVPQAPCIDLFEDIANPMLRRVLSNVREIRSLTSLRDALLPKLISGELRVPDSERLVAAHV
jgi:type I restriction enzyme S subunit